MKGDRDDKSAKTSATRNYPSAVVVNDHMYPRPCLYHFFYVSMTPFGSKTI